MTAKPIIILGSSRSNGDTYKIASKLSNGQIPIVDLRTLDISSYDYEHKNLCDNYIPLMEKLLQHNPIIFATPVYWYTMSDIMKTFIDRLSDLLTVRKDIGRKLAGKFIFVLTSYGTTLPEGFEEPFRQTCNYMKMNYRKCYYYYSGKDKKLQQNNDFFADFQKEIFSENIINCY